MGKRCRLTSCGQASMPNENAPAVEVAFTPEFKRNLRTLAKKYRHIRSDVQPIIDQIQAGKIVREVAHARVFAQGDFFVRRLLPPLRRPTCLIGPH